METLIAYTFARDARARAAAGCARVEAYYGDLWQHTADHHGYDSQSVGLHLWDRPDRTCRWPSWQDTGDLRVASVHAPLGYQRVIGDVAPYDAPALLANAVRRTPEDFLELAPPFTMAVLDPEAQRLDLFTDSIGVGRLFQLRVPDGWVWTNRPAAALLFAGVPAAAASRGWMFAAACGWFMDDSTPYEGVLAVPGATHIVADGYRQQRTVSHIETTGVWTTDQTDTARTAEETAAALQDMARSVAALWPGQPAVDLSGGRDSRIVAGAFLAAGVDVKLNSCDAVPGELQVAESLVAHLEQPVELVVSRKTIAQTRPQPLEMIDRALSWHRYADGLRPASYLFDTPPTPRDDLTINGVGGEVAHGYFYPHDVQQLDTLPLPRKLRAFSNHLQTRLVPATAGPTEEARAAVAQQIEHVLRTAVHGGIEDATMLDYFFVDERLRRWSTAGERTGVVSPLLIPSFVRAAFALDPAQRVANVLHRELVRRLVPEWADVPYFTPNPMVSDRRTPKVRCLADAADRDQIEQLLEHVEGFEPLDTLWAASAVGASSATGEATLRQALWRATFDEHLKEVNRYITPAPDGRLRRAYRRLQRRA